jgi:hypothetical protein
MKKLAPYFINGVLFFAYLYFYLKILHQMHIEERQWPQDADGADGITYVCTVWPVLLATLLLNLGWAIERCVRLFRNRDTKWTVGFAPFAVGLVWALVHCTRDYWTPILWNVV